MGGQLNVSVGEGLAKNRRGSKKSRKGVLGEILSLIGPKKLFFNGIALGELPLFKMP